MRVACEAGLQVERVQRENRKASLSDGTIFSLMRKNSEIRGSAVRTE